MNIASRLLTIANIHSVLPIPRELSSHLYCQQQHLNCCCHHLRLSYRCRFLVDCCLLLPRKIPPVSVAAAAAPSLPAASPMTNHRCHPSTAAISAAIPAGNRCSGGGRRRNRGKGGGGSGDGGNGWCRQTQTQQRRQWWRQQATAGQSDGGRQ